MKKLRLAKDAAGNYLDLPVDAVTEKIAFLGRTGSGKSFAATKLAELMLEVGAQVVALDVVGIWYGLRTGKNAIKIPVFGGLHGDVPLEPTSGSLLADLIVERDISAVLDISQMLDSEKTRFARDFADRFFYRKKSSPSAVHLFLEECQELVPQNCQKGEERMLHAFERLVKLGRNFGIGVSLISQRPQEVNKKALNQVECIFAFQMTGTHERKALEYWIADKGIDIDVMALLPKLKVGCPHVWSPRWLAISKQVAILPKRTMDTSSTPKVGAKALRSTVLTPIDLKAIRLQMAGTIEKARQEDPKELKRRIVELERSLSAKGRLAAPVAPEVKTVVAAFEESSFNSVLAQESEDFSRLRKAIQEVEAAAKRRWDNYRGEMRAAAKATQRQAKALAAVPKAGAPIVGEPPAAAQGASKLGKCELGLLAALKQHGELSLSQAAIVAGYTVTASTKDVAAAKLRQRELVQGSNAALKLTAAGEAEVTEAPRLAEGPDLAEQWMNRVGKCSREILLAVIANHPRPVTKQELSEATGYLTTSSTLDVGLSKLRKLELIWGKNDHITINDKLV